MTTVEFLAWLGVALAIDLLIGLERDWQEREGERAVGLRTHALPALRGGV